MRVLDIGKLTNNTDTSISDHWRFRPIVAKLCKSMKKKFIREIVIKSTVYFYCFCMMWGTKDKVDSRKWKRVKKDKEDILALLGF